MRPRSLASLNLVCVIWSDAQVEAVGDYTKEAAIRDLHKDTIYHSFGLLVADDDKGVLIATDEYPKDPSFRGFNRIPRGDGYRSRRPWGADPSAPSKESQTSCAVPAWVGSTL
jgi:hypothetical protein